MGIEPTPPAQRVGSLPSAPIRQTGVNNVQQITLFFHCRAFRPKPPGFRRKALQRCCVSANPRRVLLLPESLKRPAGSQRQECALVNCTRFLPPRAPSPRRPVPNHGRRPDRTCRLRHLKNQVHSLRHECVPRCTATPRRVSSVR
ncbi:hypothetical protein EVAR_62143_1 [Eumeta japonica]|uniref:Uncharacterized protein n=1 Tax=Eumeta variegata TaxID=151549 RepID=A0A4C1ZHX7_EUMVA|nr:hypothetical protein EVAR_62143_1 [Eumeta japonica]